MKRSHVFEATLALALILLTCLLYVAIVSKPPSTMGWETQYGYVGAMVAGSDDSLYVLQGSQITALKSGGGVAWRLEMPGDPLVTGEATDGRYLYVTSYDLMPAGEFDAALFADNITVLNVNMTLTAVSPGGKIAWEYNFTANPSSWNLDGGIGPYNLGDGVAVQAIGGRVYLFRDYGEDVLDADGRMLFHIDNVSCLATVDGQGNLYAVRAARPDVSAGGSWRSPDWAGALGDLENDSRFAGENLIRVAYDPTYMVKTGIVDAYRPDGSLLWSRDIGEKVAVADNGSNNAKPDYGSIIRLWNHTLYVPVLDGMASLDVNGSLNWVRHLGGNGTYVPFSLLPVDGSGNVFMMSAGADSGDMMSVYAITPAGAVLSHPWTYSTYAYPPVAGGDDLVYLITNSSIGQPDDVYERVLAGDYCVDTLTAYDIANDTALWSFRIPQADVHSLVLNESNIGEAIPDVNVTLYEKLNALIANQTALAGTPVILSPARTSVITVSAGPGVVYMSYYAVIYEDPVEFNRSRCVYVNSLFALSDDGRLLWEKPLNDLITQTVAGNHTVYYTTQDGKIGGGASGVAAGIAILASVYLFLRFFVLGTVARARGRLDANDNRKAVLKFVVDSPGATALDIARGLGMNSGTVRYHLFILTLNHRIVTHREDEKYLRYFTNGGAYSEQERSMVSLVRRKPIGKALALLVDRPGMSNVEISRELGISAVTAIRYMNELLDRGLVEKVPKDEKSFAYYVKKEHSELIRKAIRRI